MGIREQMTDRVRFRKRLASVIVVAPHGTTIAEIGWAVGWLQAADMLTEHEALTRLERMLATGLKMPREEDHHEL